MILDVELNQIKCTESICSLEYEYRTNILHQTQKTEGKAWRGSEQDLPVNASHQQLACVSCGEWSKAVMGFAQNT